jgi:hypothetical protein
MKAQGAYASISLGVKPADYDTVDRLAAEGLVRRLHHHRHRARPRRHGAEA